MPRRILGSARPSDLYRVLNHVFVVASEWRCSFANLWLAAECGDQERQFEGSMSGEVTGEKCMEGDNSETR